MSVTSVSVAPSAPKVVGVGPVASPQPVPAAPGIPGPPGPDRLHVGPTPPQNPELYDVWVDTSQ